jgi:hypothetical protein
VEDGVCERIRAASWELSVDTDKIYQRIGEFVVCYQWLEHKFREIGWLILDPWRKEWPPKQLRKESSEELIGKVESLFVDVMSRLDVPDKGERIQTFQAIVAGSHAMRKYRNNLLHSAFIELKAGGEIMAIVRSNPKIKIDPTSGDPIFDEEALTEGAIGKKLEELGKLAFSLSMHYKQLIFWVPFDSRPQFPTNHNPVIGGGPL